MGEMKNDIAEIKTEQKSQRALMLKLALLMVSASAGGAGVSHALLKLL